MRVQEFSAFSHRLDEDWLGADDASQLVQALRSLITELFGWGGDSFDYELPRY
ncbi:MAG: hypothetical protein M3N53_05600 [Actinomycetota bacterium]|nr:hypothetical protein [Actinomycetota bacterium]